MTHATNSAQPTTDSLEQTAQAEVQPEAVSPPPRRRNRGRRRGAVTITVNPVFNNGVQPTGAIPVFIIEDVVPEAEAETPQPVTVADPAPVAPAVPPTMQLQAPTQPLRMEWPRETPPWLLQQQPMVVNNNYPWRRLLGMALLSAAVIIAALILRPDDTPSPQPAAPTINVEVPPAPAPEVVVIPQTVAAAADCATDNGNGVPFLIAGVEYPGVHVTRCEAGISLLPNTIVYTDANLKVFGAEVAKPADSADPNSRFVGFVTGDLPVKVSSESEFWYIENQDVEVAVRWAQQLSPKHLVRGVTLLQQGQ